MTFMLDPTHLRGSYPPLATPFRDGAVDYAAYASLVRHQASAGSHGIVVCGTTGEPSLLSLDERRRLAEVAIDTAGQRLPVMVATGSQSLADTLALTTHAQQAGASALLVVTPYFVRPEPRGLVAYFAEVASNTDLPIVLYHIPGRAAVGLDVTTLESVVRAAPNVVGMKHASPDLGLVTDALAVLGEEFRIFVGLEELSFAMLALGAAGLVNAVGNIAPHLVADLYGAISDKDLELARRIHFQLLGLNRAIFYETNPAPLKYMMWRLGLLETHEHRLPMVPVADAVATRLDAVLRRSRLIAEAAVGAPD